MPRPNWEAICDWVEKNVPEDKRDDAWNEFARQWLARLRDSLPSSYSIHESQHFILLSGSDSTSSERILRWCELAREVILELFPGVVSADYDWKCVVLSFATQPTYYNYIADFYPDEGEFGLSGGICPSGYQHIVVCAQLSFHLERTIAHELTHALFGGDRFPRWLDEGVARLVEDVVVGNSPFLMSGETKRQHLKHWNEETIAEFWSGHSFDTTDDGSGLSYILAEVLVRNMASDYGGRFCDFLIAADWRDSGESAAQEALGVSLADRVAQFLGPGNWQPAASYEMPPAETEPEK